MWPFLSKKYFSSSRFALGVNSKKEKYGHNEAELGNETEKWERRKKKRKGVEDVYGVLVCKTVYLTGLDKLGRRKTKLIIEIDKM